MANKYYYNGKLVRTSKTHEYEYGILRGESIIACSETFENATKRITKKSGTGIKQYHPINTTSKKC